MEYQEPIQNVAAGGRIRFYKGLGLTPSNENTFFFADKEEQDNFFTANASNTITFSNGTTDNPTMVIKSPFVRTFAIPANSAELFEYDYIQVVADTNGTGAMAKPLYMFITDIQFVNPKTAVITCSLDVIQTFMFDWELGTQSVAQMHSDTIYPPFSEHLKTPEIADPSGREVCKTSKINVGDTASGGFLVVATEAPYKITLDSPFAVWYGWSAKSSVLGADFTPQVPISEFDASEFVYTYVSEVDDHTAEYNLVRLLSVYNEDDKLSAIKAIIACPTQLKGTDVRDNSVQWVATQAASGLSDKPDFSEYDTILGDLYGCTPVVPAVTSDTVALSAPSSLLGYVPNDPKTWNLLELEVATPTGEYFRVRNEDILNNSITITLKAIGGANPEILVYPSYSGSAAYPNKGYNGAKSYKIPVISLSNFPSYAIYDSDRQELFETQQTIRELGTIGNFVSKAFSLGGML